MDPDGAVFWLHAIGDVHEPTPIFTELAGDEGDGFTAETLLSCVLMPRGTALPTVHTCRTSRRHNAMANIFLPRNVPVCIDILELARERTIIWLGVFTDR